MATVKTFLKDGFRHFQCNDEESCLRLSFLIKDAGYGFKMNSNWVKKHTEFKILAVEKDPMKDPKVVKGARSLRINLEEAKGKKASVSEVFRNLEMRIARLERQANIEWKVEGFPLDGDRLKTYKFRGNERQFIKWFKGENLENLLDDIQIYGDGDDWEFYKGKLSRTARLEKQASLSDFDRAWDYAKSAEVRKNYGNDIETITWPDGTKAIAAYREEMMDFLADFGFSIDKNSMSQAGAEKLYIDEYQVSRQTQRGEIYVTTKKYIDDNYPKGWLFKL